MSGSDYEGVLRDATKRSTAESALAWLAEGRPYTVNDTIRLVSALVDAGDAGEPNASAALRCVSRDALTSDLDTTVDLSDTDSILTPAECNRILQVIVEHSPHLALSSAGPGALRAALKTHDQAMEVYAQLAGLSWRELRTRAEAVGVRLPALSRGPWTTSQLRAVVAVVSEILSPAQAENREATVPLEIFAAEPSQSGWDVVDGSYTGGVSYGHLIGQRLAGGSWGAHRNRTAAVGRERLANRLTHGLAGIGVGYWTAVGPKGTTVPRSFLSSQVARGAEGVGQLAVVTRSANGDPSLAILLAVAHDGGSARKTAGVLVNVPGLLRVPAVILLAGQGWAARAETDQLFRPYGGRVFSDRRLDELIHFAGQEAFKEGRHVDSNNN